MLPLLKRSALLLSFAVVSTQSQAAFYVDEEAPVVVANDVTTVTQQTVALDLTFHANRAFLTMQSRSSLAARAEEIRNAGEVSVYLSTAKAIPPAVVKNRAAAIKSALEQVGVPVYRIEVVDDPSPRPKDQLHVATVAYNARSIQSRQNLSPQRMSAAQLSAPRRAPAPVPVAIQQSPTTFDNATKIALLQRIAMMVKNKIVKPEEAFNLMSEVLNMQDLSSPGTPAIGPSVSPWVATAVAPDVPREWSLDPAKSLRGNLEDWARIAGWQSPVWMPADPYRVGAGTFTGSFYDALAKLSAAAPGLDFTINKQLRTLRVSELGR